MKKEEFLKLMAEYGGCEANNINGDLNLNVELKFNEDDYKELEKDFQKRNIFISGFRTSVNTVNDLWAKVKEARTSSGVCTA